MMNKIRITKNNSLGLPVGQLLTHIGFYDRPKNDDKNTWDNISVYIYMDHAGKIHTIKESIIYPEYKDFYENVIVLSNCNLGFEGEFYWKVFYDEKYALYHKLEDNGKNYAMCFKPYKDKIHRNTNSTFQPGQQRFKTLEEANSYCIKCLDYKDKSK